mgnify:FL=1
MNIYKTVFDTESQGKQSLIDKGVWQELTDKGVNLMQYINGTKSVVYIGKIVKTQGVYDSNNNEITPPIYFDGVAFDIMCEDDLDFGDNEVYPANNSVHQFHGFKSNQEIS